MKPCSVAHANWIGHVNGVNPPAELRSWLTDTTSLTRKLTLRSAQFRIKRLQQRHGRCLADEFLEIGLRRRSHVRVRDVLLQCDDRPVVFAHTVVPLTATVADWPFFNTLGERSLGSTLFGDPRVARGRLQYARLHPAHPLFRRASAAVGRTMEGPLHARRCLYRRRQGMLLVTEVFLPDLACVDAALGSWRDTVFRHARLQRQSDK